MYTLYHNFILIKYNTNTLIGYRIPRKKEGLDESICIMGNVAYSIINNVF